MYAPKLKHADEKHAPPPLGKGILAWVKPLWSATEQEMIGVIGMDATIFLRFTRMCRNLFAIMTVIGCSIMIPINLTQSNFPEAPLFQKITPMNVWNEAHWGTVIVAWSFCLLVCGFLWWNYKKVMLLRRQYFESEEYQQSLHARTLMVSVVLFLRGEYHFANVSQMYDIPKTHASDEGISRIIDEVAPNSSFSRTAVARDVKVLPQLIEEHSTMVRKLEKVLAIYLRDPSRLPAARPTCRPSKEDPSFSTYPKGQKVDAIDYLTERIRSLEVEIKDVRQKVDKRGTMGYGFASYADISEAHSIAYTCRKKKVHGATITLAPRPNDIIWDNMPLTSGVRRTRRFWNNIWVTVLTFLWIAPNAMIAIFLVNLSNLGHVWPAFQRSLTKDPAFWSLVQGIASPALTSLVYLVLPIIFRRMAIKAGDQTKSGRERHVVGKLYAFFVFNNLLVFSIFSAMWSFVAGVVQKTKEGTNAWDAIREQDFGLVVFISLCNISPFWVTWLLQRQLGAAIDLSQLWPLIYGFCMRKFSNPTPRELIELTAPPPFDYASYYNYFLFYATVTLCYAPVQPLVLPAAALYFSIDVALKKYLLLYVFVTKTESGGNFWRVLFNRFLFGTFLASLIMFLVAWVRGQGTHTQAFAIAPLPLLLILFKIYCSRVFDDKIHFYSTRNVKGRNPEGGLNVKEESMRNDRLAARFGHPALYRPLITPMVHAKAQNILASVYRGRLTDGRDAGSGDAMSVSGYSDTYVLDNMASGKTGKRSNAVPGFEVVPESRLDFEYYKNRDEFAADHGAGELFGRASDIVRSGTPNTFGGGPGSDGGSRPGTPLGGMGFGHGRRAGPPQMDGPAGMSSPYGYFPPTQQATPFGPPSFPATSFDGPPSRTRSPMYAQGNDSGTNLVQNAAGMPVTGSRPETPVSEGGPSRGGYGGLANPRAPGMLGGGPYGYGGLPQEDDAIPSPPLATQQPQDPAQYDYFRGARRDPRDRGGAPGGATRQAGGGWGN